MSSDDSFAFENKQSVSKRKRSDSPEPAPHCFEPVVSQSSSIDSVEDDKDALTNALIENMLIQDRLDNIAIEAARQQRNEEDALYAAKLAAELASEFPSDHGVPAPSDLKEETAADLINDFEYAKQLEALERAAALADLEQDDAEQQQQDANDSEDYDSEKKETDDDDAYDNQQHLEHFNLQESYAAVLPLKTRLQIGSTTLSGVELPSTWEPMPPGTDVARFDVAPGSGEWQMVDSEFQRTERDGVAMWKGAKGGTKTMMATRIERLQNLDHYKWYALYREDIKTKRGANNVNERALFHAAKNAQMTQQIVEEGFDMRLAREGGSIGAGIYFAPCAQTSRAYITSSTNSSTNLPVASSLFVAGSRQMQMFLAYAILGISAAKHDPASTRRPPKGADSVGSDESGQFAVFDNRAVYAAYLITFTCEN
jgi:hypothetical protein